MRPSTRICDLPQHAGQPVTIRGWLEAKRSGGKVQFLQVRDGTGTAQCIVEAQAEDAFEAATSLSQESSLELGGSVRLDERAPGGCEISVTDVRVLQIAQEYPISRKAHGIEFLMANRHLWLRSHRQSTLMKIRHTLIRTARNYFDDLDFTLIDTPILSPGAAEGAGTLFPVDFYGDEVYLAQTGQLYLESAAMALGKVYCFGPTFRAEKSKTRRHLSEFWMLEPEVAFAELPEIIALAEGLICELVQATLNRHRADLESLGRDIGPLEKVTGGFPRITYTEAVELLRSPATADGLAREQEEDQRRLEMLKEELAHKEEQRASARKPWQQDTFAREAQALRDQVHDLEETILNRPLHMQQAAAFEWGKDLGGAEETILSRQFEQPLVVTEYPAAAKAFYMKRSPQDPRVALNLDILAPEGYGEIVGGSQREENLDLLTNRMREEDMDPEPYDWYLDLRRYGSIPHGGFGIGIERTLAWICGIKHVREAIPFARMMGRIYP